MHENVDLFSFLPYNKMLPLQLVRQTRGLKATRLTWATTVITDEIRTIHVYLDNLVEYILLKKIIKIFLMLNIKTFFKLIVFKKNISIFYIFSYVKNHPYYTTLLLKSITRRKKTWVYINWGCFHTSFNFSS